jgi:hypothetical protein
MVRDFIDGSGKRGLEVRKKFQAPPYGWPQDAIDGAILALMAGGFVRATRSGQPVGVKEISQSLLPSLEFYGEGITISALQRIQVRKLITDLGFPVKPGEEAEAIPLVLHRLGEMADSAGGDPPLSRRPATAIIDRLLELGGNAQFLAVYENREQLLQDYQQWKRQVELIAQRQPRWQTLLRLLEYARSLPVYAQVQPQVASIRDQRTLLNEPDPLLPLQQKLTDALRLALQQAKTRLIQERDQELAGLEATQEWQNLPEPERQEILAAYQLASTPELKVGTEAELLAVLEAEPLSSWENRIAALPGWAGRAREEAARRLTPEAIHLQLPHTTLRSVQDMEAYLESLRQEIMQHIADGKPVIL